MKKDTSHDGNIYDKYFKENALEIFLPFLQKYFNSKIKKAKRMHLKQISSAEREVDCLVDIFLENGENFLLHLEFQTTIDPDMIYRVSEYHGIFLRSIKRK